jgi:hypothetical protein
MKSLNTIIKESNSSNFDNKSIVNEAAFEPNSIEDSCSRSLARKLPELIDLLEECYLAGNGAGRKIEEAFDISIFKDFEQLKSKMKKSLKLMNKAGYF